MSRVRHLALWLALVAAYLVLIALSFWLIIANPTPDDFPRRCGLLIGGWHPDIPHQYAARCRALDAQKVKPST